MGYRYATRGRQGTIIFVIGLVIAIVLLSSVTLFGFRRGGIYTTSGEKESNTNHSMEMSYSSFEGDKYTNLKLDAGEKVNFNINVKTISGYLNIYIIDNNGNNIYSIDNTKKSVATTVEQTISTSIVVEKSGTYRIKVKGKHSGSYNIQWDIVKK